MGSHLCRHLLTLNHRVIVLDDLSGGFIENIPEQSIFVKGSIVCTETVTNLFEEYSFDYVYH